MPGNIEYKKLILDCVQSNALPLLPEFGHFELIRSWRENDEEFKKAHPARQYIYVTIDPMNVRTERIFQPGAITEHEIPVVILSAHSDFEITISELTSMTKLTPIIRAATLAIAKNIQGQFHSFLRSTPYSVGIIPGSEQVGTSISEKYIEALKLYDAPGRPNEWARGVFCTSDTKWKIEEAFVNKERFVNDNRYYCFPQPERKTGHWNPGIGLASDATLRGIVRYALRARCGSGRDYIDATTRERPGNGDYDLLMAATSDAFNDGIAYLLSLRAFKIKFVLKQLVKATNNFLSSIEEVWSAINKEMGNVFGAQPPNTDIGIIQKKIAKLKKLGLTNQVVGTFTQEHINIKAILNPALIKAGAIDSSHSFTSVIDIANSFGLGLAQLPQIMSDLQTLLAGIIIPEISNKVRSSIGTHLIFQQVGQPLQTLAKPTPSSKERLDVAEAVCHILGGQTLLRGGKYRYEEEYNRRVKEFHTNKPNKVFDDNALGDVVMYASIAQEHEVEKNKNPGTAENDLFAIMYAVAWRLNGDVGTESDFLTKMVDLLIENNKMTKQSANALAKTTVNIVTAAEYPKVTLAPNLDYDPIMMISKWDAPSLDDYNNPSAPYGTTQPINIQLEGMNIESEQIEAGDIFTFCDLWHANSGGRIVRTTETPNYPQEMTFKVISASTKGATLMARSYDLSIAPYPVPAGRTKSCDRMPRRFMRINTSRYSKAKMQPNQESCVFASPNSLGLITLPLWKGREQSESDPVWENRYMEVNNLKFELQEQYDGDDDKMKYKLILKLGVGLLDPRSVVSFDIPRI